MSSRPRVLVVEDEIAIQELLRYSLEQAPFEVVVVSSAEQALSEIRSELPSLVLLDLMLPGMSGINLVRHLRSQERTRELPIIMVTARADEADRIGGLNIGADDYVTKPFSPRELIARMRAVLRRRSPHLAGDVVEVGALRLDPQARTVSCNQQAINLAPTEFDLLHYLMSHPNRALTRDQLLNALRGDHVFLEDRTIDVYIRRLRAGLGTAGEAMIATVRGVGYKFVRTP
ncbi:phosphate regulon transcriptional regulator PhoB [Accumulibacter sp.]|uniref:phosphate regulon transcriptional regulator PhoB n=2 Tax=Accumulibacter sp. TaxID=2053492 RepID=UPI00262A17D0|nr:phosphate regulon transcriptional regulator PhoB [Accumulibacter sp.]